MYDLCAAAAAASPRGDDTQDRVVSYRRTPAGDSAEEVGVVLCDGVGSYRDAGAVAERAMELAVHHLEQLDVCSGIFTVAEAVNAGLELDVEGATTLLAVGADAYGRACYAYVGNGSLIELEPRSPVGDRVQLRWVGLELPHLDWSGGLPALASYLPIDPDALSVSTGSRLGAKRASRLLLACSDGIATDEDRVQARTADGRYWKSVPAPLARIVDELSQSWNQLVSAAKAEAQLGLESALQRALDSLLDEAALEDDASVGCVLLRSRAEET